jgi:ABC-type antimicrobial peptide transport system permease subunit
MLRRIIYEDWQLIFPVVALAVASCVYLVAAWRASSMKPAQADRLARLPFENE